MAERIIPIRTWELVQIERGETPERLQHLGPTDKWSGFVTEDTAIIQDRGWDDATWDDTDRQIISQAESGEGMILVNTETLEDLRDRMGSDPPRKNPYLAMSLDPAGVALVRFLRVYSHYSWRLVARTMARRYGGDWGSNQLIGMGLCERAARHYGENYMEKPWN